MITTNCINYFSRYSPKTEHRSALIQTKYAHIPYLNSSLFEFSELEDCTIKINALDDNLDIDFYSASVLKKHGNNSNVKTRNTLHYLFDFLDAYNFASVGKEEVQEENKTIINAAVLGLVFEKLTVTGTAPYTHPAQSLLFYAAKPCVKRS